MNLLQQYGPLWVAAEVFAPHIRVVTGFEYVDDANNGVVYINDPLERGMIKFKNPNNGSAYTETYLEFVHQNETLGFAELSIDDPNLYPVYFAHLARKP